MRGRHAVRPLYQFRAPKRPCDCRCRLCVEMIISHKYKFIFIKTNKTAGTSIEIGLSRFCAPSDVITPVAREDERIRKRLGYPGPQNIVIPYSKYGVKDWLYKLVQQKTKQFYNHMPAYKIKPVLGPRIWDDYFKFCVERNPWDRTISCYYWKTRNRNPAPTITEFIDSGEVNVLKKKGFQLYTINGKVAVDHICRYEDLDKELETIAQMLKLPQKITLPRAKGQYRKRRESYRQVLSPSNRDKIARIFADEIAQFGYGF